MIIIDSLNTSPAYLCTVSKVIHNEILALLRILVSFSFWPKSALLMDSPNMGQCSLSYAQSFPVFSFLRLSLQQFSYPKLY